MTAEYLEVSRLALEPSHVAFCLRGDAGNVGGAFGRDCC